MFDPNLRSEITSVVFSHLSRLCMVYGRMTGDLKQKKTVDSDPLYCLGVRTDRTR